MRCHNLATARAGRQKCLVFDSDRLQGLEALDRDKVVIALAHILMQAAGLKVEETDDGEL
jgi:hypothetical protein